MKIVNAPVPGSIKSGRRGDISPAANNQPINPKPNRLRALAFLEIGLAEIGFVAVAFLLLFGALNYFNILPVSDVFPNQLGWLPQREVPTGTSPRQQSETNLASQGQALQNSQGSASPSPEAFAYDTALAKTLLTQYIKDNIKPNLLPSDFGKITPSQFAQNPNYFVQSFTAQGASVSAYFRYNKSSNEQNSLSISINLKGDAPTSPMEISNALASFFANPYLISNCKQDDSFTFCENFQATSESRKGYGIQILKKASGTVTTVFTCQIPKESADYPTAKSCIGF